MAIHRRMAQSRFDVSTFTRCRSVDQSRLLGAHPAGLVVMQLDLEPAGALIEGETSQHTFTLGDETSMAANVCGPALGYINAGLWLHDRGMYGVFPSSDLMPRFAVPAKAAAADRRSGLWPPRPG